MRRAENGEDIRRKQREYNSKNREKIIKNCLKYRTNNPEKIFACYLKHEYNVTLKWWKNKLIEQDYSCFVCRFWFHTHKGANRYKKPNLDHDHKTGLPRGLLCGWCNHALGLANDSVFITQNLINYVQPHNRKRNLI